MKAAVYRRPWPAGWKFSDGERTPKKAGCEEWREGITIWLNDEAKQQAKKYEAENACGMLAFSRGFVFSCSLQNDVEATRAEASTIESTTGTLKWNAPATLSGILKSGTYSDCCIHGVAQSQRYIFIHLDSKVPMKQGDDAEYEPAMDEVEDIQLGAADIPKESEGRHLLVTCKQILLGNTGHYALPVFCEEPNLK